MSDEIMKPTFAYVGSYTTEGDITVSRNAHAKGIKVFKVSQPECIWELVQETETLNPAVIALSRDGGYLYCVESDSNTVSAFSVDAETGNLAKLNSAHTGGTNSIVIGIDNDNSCLIAADHSGLLSAFHINADGSIGTLFAETIAPGKVGPLNPTFQPHSRPHNLVFTPDGKYCLIPDKGLDKIHVFAVDPKKDLFALKSQVDCRRAGCPRHIVMSPDGRTAYMNLELGNLIVAYDFEDGVLEPFQIVPSLPEYYVGNVSKTSEIDIHPSGRWLYVSNRGHDSIAVYRIDQESRCLTPIQWAETYGKIPRFFMVDPSGKTLLCCNQFSDSIAVFAINSHYGTLELREIVNNVDGPVWMQLSSGMIPPAAVDAKPGQGLV